MESQRAVPAATCRILGARGRADVGGRLAAAAVADARVQARPVGHRRRQEKSAARRRRRCRRRRNRAGHGGADRGAPGRRAAWRERSVVGSQRHQVGRRGPVRVRSAHHRHAGRLRTPLRPDGASGAARGAGARTFPTTRPSANSRCARRPRWASAPRPTSATISGYPRNRSSPRSPTWLLRASSSASK